MCGKAGCALISLAINEVLSDMCRGSSADINDTLPFDLTLWLDIDTIVASLTIGISGHSLRNSVLKACPVREIVKATSGERFHFEHVSRLRESVPSSDRQISPTITVLQPSGIPPNPEQISRDHERLFHASSCSLLSSGDPDSVISEHVISLTLSGKMDAEKLAFVRDSFPQGARLR